MYSNPLTVSIFVLVCGAWIISEILGPVRWSGMREGKRRDRKGKLGVVVACGLGGIGLCLLLPLLLPQATIPGQPEIFWGGVVVTLLGIGWRWYAIATLGRFFTAALILHPDQHVVQHGPYKVIRHPSYSGILLAMVGLGLMLGNWVSLLILTAGLSFLVCSQIPREEQELLTHLGQPYQEYMQRTWRLIPFVF